MTTPVRCTNCSASDSFADELKRLADQGLIAAPHSDIQRLKPGEFIVYTPARPNSDGSVRVYYREQKPSTSG